jgi:hypothetical protein
VRGRAHRALLQRALLLALLAAVLAACTFQLDVDVTIAKDGSGSVEAVVTLDDAAIANVGGDLGKALALGDLEAKGWTVQGPTRGADGHTTLRVRRTFADPAGAATAFQQLSGKGGPFQDFAVTRHRSLTSTRWGFTGQVDLERGLGDRNPKLSQDLTRLGDQLGSSLSRLVPVRVRVRLPGQVSSNATTKAANGAVWQVRFGGPPLHLQAQGTERRTSTYVLVGLGGLVALVLVVYGLVRLAGRTTEGRDLRR